MKYLETRKHSFEGFMNNMEGVATAKDVQNVFEWYLAKLGAHPLLLSGMLSIWLTAGRQNSSALKKGAEKTFRKFGYTKEFRDFGSIKDPLSLIYNNDGDPIANVDEGLLETSLLINYCLLIETVVTKASSEMKHQSIATYVRNSEMIISHPQASLQVVHSSWYWSAAIETVSVHFGERLIICKSLRDAWESCLKKLWDKYSPSEFAFGLTDIWFDKSPGYFWGLFELILGRGELFNPEEHKFTRIIEALFALSESGPKRHKHSAQRILKFYPAYQNWDSGQSIDKSFIEGLAVVCCAKAAASLREELPHPLTYQLLIRWMQYVEPLDRLTIIYHLAMRGEEVEVRMDERGEYLLESLLGMNAWKALCAFQDEGMWEETELNDQSGIIHRAGVKFESPEGITLLEALNKINWDRNEYHSIVAVEQAVHDSGVTQLEAETVKSQRLFLLSEEVVRTVTHTYTHPAVLRRRQDEFLGAALPKVSLRTKSNDNSYGAACEFQIYAPGQDIPITGEMDEDGNISFHNILSATPLTARALEGVVIDSLCQILVPKLVDSLPQTGPRGFRIPGTSEVYAVRPVVHTLGDLQNRDNHSDEVSGGTRIHPEIATLLFQWLLGDKPDYSFRLYKKVSLKQKGGKETYYCSHYDAHELIISGRIALSDVFMRTVRAHSKPLGVCTDLQGNINVQQMSSRAGRNYGRYLKDIGRKLDFSPVRKTYVLPDGRRIVLDVPRTFNQGAFCSLDEVWKFVPNLDVKARAHQYFRF